MSYIVLRDGQKLEVAEIEDLEVAVDALVYLDESIISIEEQLDRAAADGETSSEWAIKARTAVKHRRRARAPLQERIGQLRRAAKAASVAGASKPAPRALPWHLADVRKVAWHRAFVAAVRQIMPQNQFESISQLADKVADEAVEEGAPQ